MSRPCAITKCNRTSRCVCDCCQENLCLQHLNEHNASLIDQLNPLIDDINALGDRLKTLNIQKAAGRCRQKLEQWRLDCHQKIDSFFEQKCEELDRLVQGKVDKKREEIIRIQSKMAELIHAQETTRQEISSLTSSIRHFEENMNNIEQTYLQIHTRPLMINDSLIRIEEMNEQEIHVSPLPTLYKTIKGVDVSVRCLASSDRFLLIHDASNLCLFDRESNKVKQVVWPHDKIFDMCWSSILNQFIVVEENNVFLVDENTMSIDRIQTMMQLKYLSCTCSDAFLFLSTSGWGSSIIALSLIPSIKLMKQWKHPDTCDKDEGIDGIAHNNETLALMIINKSHKSRRIELRSAETLTRIWLLPLDIVWTQTFAVHCCSLVCNEWLVVDTETRRLLQITKDGKIKETVNYNPRPYRVSLSGPNMLAVLTTDGVNLHKLQPDY